MRIERIVMTDVAWQAAGDRIAAVVPEADIVRVRRDGSLVGHDAGDGVLGADVAWATFDLYDDPPVGRLFYPLVEDIVGLRWAQLSTAGVDAPVFGRLLRRGVRLSTAHVTAGSIADYVLRAVLDTFQGAGQWRAAQAAGQWRRHRFQEMDGSVWLVVGVGAIGRQVAIRARACGARVIGCRRHPHGDEPADEMVTPDQLSSVLPRVDAIVLAAPANPGTHSLVDDEFLSSVKPGAVLVNVARGALVDETALRRAVDTGRLGAAVLDAFDPEPLAPESWLWTHPQVTVTPHNSSGGQGREARSAQLFIDNLQRYLNDAPLLHEVAFPAAT